MIIESLLDTDIYKYLMHAVLHQFPGAEVEYRFTNTIRSNVIVNPGCTRYY